MNILSLHCNYKIRGGEEESRDSEERLLRSYGHQVDTYEESNTRLDSMNPVDIAIKTVWSTEAYKGIQSQLRQKPYDLIHVQNFFPLISPAAYYAAKAEGVPVVQTLRNYRLLCPNALFFRQGKVCEDCVGKPIPYPGVLHGCYRESRVASAGVATMLSVHRAMNTWVDKVDLYIALTEFARQKFIAGGIPADKIVVKPNFVSPDPGPGEGKGNYALYVGRLSVEKGLDTLLTAWEQLKNPIPLKIIGDGPLSDMVVAATKRLPSVEWLGRRPMTEVHELLGGAMFSVFPSKWYETFGRVAVEAFAKGTPVVASRIGAIAELIDSERTGVLFEPGNADDLSAKVAWMLSDRARLTQMRQETRAEYEQKYTAETNYQRFMEVYASIVPSQTGCKRELLAQHKLTY